MLGRAELSGFIQSQDNDRQRAQRLDSDGGQERPRTITRVKLYLPCEVLTRDRMKAGERLSQLWLGDLAGIRGAEPQICQEFC